MAGDDNGAMQTNTANRTSIRKIVLKSSFKRVQAYSLNFAHINPGSAVPHIAEMNELFSGIDDLHLIAISETWYKKRFRMAT